MGLDIRVYKNIKELIPENKEILDEDSDDDYEDYDDYDFKVFVPCVEWKDRVKNLNYNSFYSGDCVNGEIGYSYSTHTWFRGLLAELIGYEPNQWQDLDDKSIPFAYLFDFSDCEGCFDWEISEFLYNDFEKYKDVVNKSENERFVFIYKQWLEALKLAKDKGVVVFR